MRRLTHEGQKPDKAAYDVLAQLIGGKDYFVVTTVTDGAVYDTASLDPKRWRPPLEAALKSCVKDIWRRGEIPEGIRPHSSYRKYHRSRKLYLQRLPSGRCINAAGRNLKQKAGDPGIRGFKNSYCDPVAL